MTSSHPQKALTKRPISQGNASTPNNMGIYGRLRSKIVQPSKIYGLWWVSECHFFRKNKKLENACCASHRTEVFNLIQEPYQALSVSKDTPYGLRRSRWRRDPDGFLNTTPLLGTTWTTSNPPIRPWRPCSRSYYLRSCQVVFENTHKLFLVKLLPWRVIFDQSKLYQTHQIHIRRWSRCWKIFTASWRTFSC